jgi:hypothetical protein
MNFIQIIVLVFLNILNAVKPLRTKSFERMIDPEHLSRAKGEDILKILNLDRNKSISIPTDVEESEVLKYKSKNIREYNPK